MRPYSTSPASQVQVQQQHEHSADEEETESDAGWLGGASALKYLLAGGIAGAVSRSATAPFDRLKVYLITRSPDIPPVGKGMPGKEASARGGKILLSAVRGIWMEGGIGGFWIGNGLNVVKIFPVSEFYFLCRLISEN
jgi:solute carrier family 25 phosphate transporter 23/24/25/41